MAGEMQLPPWLAQSNTDLMPRAMVAGAQVGNVIADNLRMAAAAQQNAALAKQKQMQEAIRYQGFQEYQRDISNGVNAGEAIQKHGAKMYFGETVFPQMLNTMQRNADWTANQKRFDEFRKDKEANDKLNDVAKNKLAEQFNKIREETLRATELRNKETNDRAVAAAKQKAEWDSLTPIAKNLQLARKAKGKADEAAFMGDYELSDSYVEDAKAFGEANKSSRAFKPTEAAQRIAEMRSEGIQVPRDLVEDLFLVAGGVKARPKVAETKVQFIKSRLDGLRDYDAKNKIDRNDYKRSQELGKAWDWIDYHYGEAENHAKQSAVTQSTNAPETPVKARDYLGPGKGLGPLK